MCRRVIAVAVLGVGLVSCTMWNKPASGWSGATGGEHLEKLFWDDVHAGNIKSLDQHIAATFAGSGPDGPQDREAFLKQLQAYRSQTITLRDCSSRLNGAELVVTCAVQRRDGGGTLQASTLSVWQQLKKGWVMVAHAETPMAGH